MRKRKIILIGLTSILALIALPIAGMSAFILMKCPKQEITIPIEDHTAEIDGLTVYYRTAGNLDAQPVVFLHGWGATNGSRCGTDGVIAALAEHFYVIAPEHPGFIRSEPPKTPWTFEEYALALRSLLSPLQLPKFILMSQSWGGGIASMYAKLYPANVQTLVFVDAKLGSRRESWYTRLRFTFNSIFSWVVESRIIPFSVKQFIVSASMGIPQAILTKDSLAAYAVMGEILPYSYDFHVDYAALPMPILLVWGDRDTWVSDMERAKEVAREAQNGKFLTVPGTHTVLYQRPKEIVDLIVSSLPEL